LIIKSKSSLDQESERINLPWFLFYYNLSQIQQILTNLILH
jgi:hypothetical protein